MIKLRYNYAVIEDELEVCKQVQARMDQFPDWECLGLI